MSKLGLRELLLALVIAMIVPDAHADHPSIVNGTGGAGPINTISASAVPARRWSISLRSERVEFNAFNNSQLEAFAAQGFEGVHSVDELRKTSASATYGFTDKWAVSLLVSKLTRLNIREGEFELGVAETHVHGDSSALADAVLMGQYTPRASQNSGVAFLIGLKPPTGKTHEMDNNGERYDTEFQPGTGSWDFLVGGAARKSMQRLSLYGNLIVYLTTEGAQNTQMGHAAFYNAAICYRLTGHEESDDHGAHAHGPQWTVMLELNGETRGRNSIMDVSQAHSGGSIVYASPGVRAVFSNGLGLFVSLGIPIYEHRHGFQTEITRRIVMGVSLSQ